MPDIQSIIAQDAVEPFLQYIRQQGMNRFDLVADADTWQALGERVCGALAAKGAEVRTVLLTDDEIIADEEQIVQVMLDGIDPSTVFVAVGSGTITDITRFVSHRCGRPFISLPTAPSVDAYSSVNSPLVVRRLKRTVNAQAPLAVFSDLDTLCAAPRPMVAAGFGDVIGKYVCLADWQLGHLLWDEPYNAEIAADSRRALERVAAQAASIGRLEPEGIRALMEGLILSGISMARMGTSSPASASEHHLSHYWEMRLLQENRPAMLHGAKVGCGAVLMAGEYERIRALTREQALATLEKHAYPDAETQRRQIRLAYGSLAEQVTEQHQDYVMLADEGLRAVETRIAENWDAIQEIAATVPPASEIARLLQLAGGVTRPQELGLGDEEVLLAHRHGHYIRNRFTVRKLELLLGLSIEESTIRL